MKGKKTKEYRLEINAYDTITTSFIISETTYKEKLRELQEQVAKAKDGPSEFEAEEATKVVDHPQYTKTVYHVNLCMTDIDLISVICKPGFCFK